MDKIMCFLYTNILVRKKKTNNTMICFYILRKGIESYVVSIKTNEYCLIRIGKFKKNGAFSVEFRVTIALFYLVYFEFSSSLAFIF
jgi:hypothetical protein